MSRRHRAGPGASSAALGSIPAALGSVPAALGSIPAALGSFPAALGSFPAALGLLSALFGLATIATPVGAAGAGAPTFGYRVVAAMPHAADAFTQGLLIHAGELYESTGGYGDSSLRRVRLADGKVLARFDLPRRLFGEGLALHGDYLFQLTWRSGLMMVYRRDDFEPVRSVRYRGEGWGLASAGDRLVMSNGSSTLTWLSTDGSRVLGRTQVTNAGTAVENLNELEWLPAAGEGGAVAARLLANVWTRDQIAVIDPNSGRVLAWIDLTGLMRGPFKLGPDAVLNGIAFDHATRRLYVTGKNWPRLFEIATPALDGYLVEPFAAVTN